MTTEHTPCCDPEPLCLRARHRGLAGLVTLGCALLGACDDPRGAPGLTATSPRDGDEPVLDPAEQWCPKDRRIARVGPGACVDKSNAKGSWDAVKLFADGTPSLAGAGVPPKGLANYCQYTWTPTGSYQGDPDLGLLDGIGAHASDCEVVWQQSDPLSEALSPALSATYLDHLDAPAAEELTGTRQPVMVAVIDSLSKTSADGRSSHGESMGALIEGVHCAGQPCDSSVHYRLALPRYLDEQHATQRDWVSGGNFGSQGELARAIFGAVREWETHGSVGHLILNLSVGWEPSFGGTGAPANMPAPVRAVFDALQYASCKGALIVAAAGNASGSCEAGPMAPALWENHLAPGIAACNDLGAPNRPAFTSSDRLVYAAVGLRHDGRLIASTRDGDLPRLAAPAFAAVNDAPGAPHVPMTGSSLAAASVSAVASLVWSYEHTLPPSAVIQRIYDTGIADVMTTPGATVTLPEFGVPGIPRRVSACKALAACVPTLIDTCPDVTCNDLPPDLAGLAVAASDAYAAIEALSTTPVFVDLRGTFNPRKQCDDACGIELMVRTTSGVSGDPCDRDHVVGLDRATSPQPRSTPCPACWISNGAADTAYLMLDDIYDQTPITGVGLVVTTNGNRERIELGALALSSDEPLTVTLPGNAIAANSTVIMHITYADGDTQSHELRVQ